MLRIFQISKFLASAFVLLMLGAFLFVAPNSANAIQITSNIDSTMTITLQKSSDVDPPDDDPSGDDPSDDPSTDDSSANNGDGSTKVAVAPVTASEKGGGLPITGDVLLLAIFGAIALCAGSFFCVNESRKLESVQGAHVRRSSRGVHTRPQNPEDVKKRVMAAAIASVLLAGTCFGGLASKTNALAEGIEVGVKCTSAVKIDETGNVLSANVTVFNNSLKVIDVAGVAAPAELQDWTATFSTTSVAVSGIATGTWDGTTVPAEILQEVKTNGSSTLTFKLTIEYDEDKAVVTFDGKAPSGTTATVDGASASKTQYVDIGTSLTSDIIPADASVLCSDTTWQFAGWAEDPASLPSAGLKNADLAEQAVLLTGQKTYYAIWKDTATGDFWLSSTNTNGTQASDFTSDANYRTGREILSDIGILNAGATNSSYSTVLSRWNSYYNSDVKLYATWSGSDVAESSSLNKLVEFRILQVGEHDGDGTVVTFGATHALPTAKAMNPSDTSVGSWASSAMRNSVMSDYVQAGLPGDLVDAAKATNKATTSVSKGAWETDGSTYDKFWLLSNTEMFGEYDDGNTLIPNCFFNEGSRYSWFVKNGVNAYSGWSSVNASIADLYKTRAGGTPAGADYENVWLRSPYVYYSDRFGATHKGGYPDFISAHYCIGVVPCFSFGPASVTFVANAPNGTTATVDGENATKTTNVVKGTTLGTDMIPEASSVTCSDDTWEFVGWSEDPASLPSEASTKEALAAEAVELTGQKTYYAVWKDTASNEFWLSSTNTSGTQESDFSNDANYRTAREILNDITILRAGTINASYETVLERWNGYYDDDARLYSIYEGGARETMFDGTTTSALNGLVEFRILQVGAHDGDGSVVTFMATHVLPTAEQMNATHTNVGGWNATALRSKLQSGGEIYAKFPSALTSAIKEVKKLNHVGGGSTSQTEDGTATEDAFWLISYSELYKTGIYATFAPKNEGTAYNWCQDKNIDGYAGNAALCFKTRSGATPGSCNSDNSYWWERSPFVGSSGTFERVKYDGDPSTDGVPSNYCGVAPCFAF